MDSIKDDSVRSLQSSHKLNAAQANMFGSPMKPRTTCATLQSTQTDPTTHTPQMHCVMYICSLHKIMHPYHSTHFDRLPHKHMALHHTFGIPLRPFRALPPAPDIIPMVSWIAMDTPSTSTSPKPCTSPHTNSQTKAPITVNLIMASHSTQSVPNNVPCTEIYRCRILGSINTVRKGWHASLCNTDWLQSVSFRWIPLAVRWLSSNLSHTNDEVL